MDRLKVVREIMQWVSKREQTEQTMTMTTLADQLDMPRSTVHRIVTRIYPECFVVEPYVGVKLTGKWPEDIAFDWETLKPLEKHDSTTKFRPPKDGFTPPAKAKQIDWSQADDYLYLMNGILKDGSKLSLEEFVDTILPTEYDIVHNGFAAVLTLMEKRGREQNPGFFYKTTGLHYT